MYYKLSHYAKKFDVTYRTAWNHFKEGKIEGAFFDERTNRILIPVELFKENATKKVALYARVSNNEAKENLERQIDRIRNYSISNGYDIVYEVKEISSGLNDQRPKLIKLLKKDDYDLIVVENKDRLTRFGFNYIKVLLQTKNKDVLVINNTSSDKKTDLIGDLVSIMYSFSARIYGLRKGKQKTEELKTFLEKNDF